jgi:phospholipid/cholesterol/gamma-HCH transport system substrate-binding protein
LKISNETKIGVLTVISVVLLIIGFNILKGNDVFSRSQTIYAEYNDVQGLGSSSPVQVNGLNIGHISSLSIDQHNPGKILVKMTINKNIHIPVNSLASIVSPDLLSSKTIRIAFGDATTFLKDNDTITTGPPGSLTTQVMNEVEPLSLKVQATMGYLDTVLLDIHNLMTPGAKNDIQSSIKQLKVTMANLAITSGRVNEMMQNLLSISGNLKNDNDTINHILSNVKTITSNAADADLEGTIKEFKKSLTQLNGIMAKINSGTGSLGLLVNNKKLYNNLEQSTLNLNRLLEDLRLNPQRYIHFSVFGKKNKVVPLPADSVSQ